MGGQGGGGRAREGTGGGNLGVNGVGSVQETGEERVRSRVPKVAGTRRNYM